MSLGQKILEVMGSTETTMREIYDAVPGKRSSIDKARQRLLKAGKIERVSHGVYRKSGDHAGGGDEKNEKNVSDWDKDNEWLTLIGNEIEEVCPKVDASTLAKGEGIAGRLELLHGFFASCANITEELYRIAKKIERENTPEDRTFDNLFRGENSKEIELKVLVNILLEYWIVNSNR